MHLALTDIPDQTSKLSACPTRCLHRVLALGIFEYSERTTARVGTTPVPRRVAPTAIVFVGAFRMIMVQVRRRIDAAVRQQRTSALVTLRQEESTVYLDRITGSVTQNPG
ncbi:hypothetical protein BC834DRAFT_433737 [Gloeopeniophorella convolvens]|nr:hypothetical protein BC834DRAFT_433737 [Gloeopeniophorella convolvens]